MNWKLVLSYESNKLVHYGPGRPEIETKVIILKLIKMRIWYHTMALRSPGPNIWICSICKSKTWSRNALPFPKNFNICNKLFIETKTNLLIEVDITFLSIVQNWYKDYDIWIRNLSYQFDLIIFLNMAVGLIWNGLIPLNLRYINSYI